MADKRRELSGLGPGGQSPGSLTAAEYLQAQGNGSSRPVSPSGEHPEADASVPARGARRKNEWAFRHLHPNIGPTAGVGGRAGRRRGCRGFPCAGPCQFRLFAYYPGAVPQLLGRSAAQAQSSPAAGPWPIPMRRFAPDSLGSSLMTNEPTKQVTPASNMGESSMAKKAKSAVHTGPLASRLHYRAGAAGDADRAEGKSGP